MPDWSDPPWKANEGRPDILARSPKGDYWFTIADVRHATPTERAGTGASLANARLMAAAPDLVEALEAMLGIVNNSEGVTGWHRNGDVATWDEFEEVDIAEAALAKALGETFT